jgi:hypothetical protein
MKANEKDTDEFDLKLQLLDKANSNQVAYILAGHPSLSPAARIRLSRDKDRNVRRRIAESKQTSIDVLQALSCDPESEVRLAIADNPSTPDYILEQLAADEDLDVRYGIAENANAPPQILMLLADDTNPYISTRAKRTIARSGGIPTGSPVITFISPVDNFSKSNRKQSSF